MKKKLVSLLLVGACLSPNITVLANELDTSKENLKVEFKDKSDLEKATNEEKEVFEKYDYKIKEILEKDESVKKALEKGAKLVGVSDIYIKYTPDETSKNSRSSNEQKYISEEFSYDEYIQEVQNEKKSARGIGNYVEQQNSRWMNLYMSIVYYGDGIYSATSYFDWKTNPLFMFTDAHGINVSPEFNIITDAPGNYSEYVYVDAFNNLIYKNTTNTMIFNSFGSVSEVDLKWEPVQGPLNDHYGKHQVVFEWSNTGGISGNVYNTYLHKEVAGGISIDSSGKPSFGINIASDSHSGAITIRR